MLIPQVVPEDEDNRIVVESTTMHEAISDRTDVLNDRVARCHDKLQ